MAEVGPYQDAEILKEWPDGSKIVRLYTHRDMVTLGHNGGGCSAAHSFWSADAKPISEYFFVLLDKKDNTGVILFTKLERLLGKPHPQEHTHGLPSYTYYTRDNVRSCVTSTAYDVRNVIRNPVDANKQDIEEAEYSLKRAKENYNRVKEQAIRYHGPLHAGHPDKRYVDEYNRQVGTCKAALDAAKKSGPSVRQGTLFTWNRKRLVVLQIAGKGGYYLKDNTDDMNKIREFVYGKDKSA